MAKQPKKLTPKQEAARSGEKAERLLLRAESSFITDPQRRSLDHWFEAILVGIVTIDRTRAHALEQRWSERRQSFWRGVLAAWLKQQQVTLIQQRGAELQQAVELRTVAYDLVKPKVGEDGQPVFAIQPKSWEGAVRAFVSLDDVVEGKREGILGQLDPMLASTEEQREDGPNDLPFSRDEMRLVAHQLLARRRHKRRAELGIEDDDEDSDESESDSGSETLDVAGASVIPGTRTG